MGRKRIMTPLEHRHATLEIRWISKKEANFTKGKTYVATAMSRRIGGDRLYSNFKVTDDEGDFVSLSKEELDRKYEIVK